MNDEIVAVVAETIRQTVKATPTKTITGGKIWQAVRAAYPDFKPADLPLHWMHSPWGVLREPSNQLWHQRTIPLFVGASSKY